LLDMEHDGAKFFDGDRAEDEIAILRRHGCEIFRVRLFVDPDKDPQHNYGATQDLAAVRLLGQRIKNAGGRFLLDLHYSDTWADPIHQQKPLAWKDDDFESLVGQVGSFTRSVIRDLQRADAAPDMVQVGNEIGAGMLWPDGKVAYDKSAEAQETWRRLNRLVAAGADAVRQCQRTGEHIRIVLHVQGGGHPDLPQNFFRRLTAASEKPIDFDVIGLSFYPTWDDSIDTLRKNANDLAREFNKDIFLAEVAYPWADEGDIGKKATMRWPSTPQGQVDFLRDVRKVLSDLPDGHGIGFAWWYSDSVPVRGRKIWRDGREALFDRDGHALPAVRELDEPTATRPK